MSTKKLTTQKQFVSSNRNAVLWHTWWLIEE